MAEPVSGWRRLLAARATPAVVLALAVALVTPSLTCGLSADDWYHELIAEGRPLPGMTHRRLDLFTFADGRPADNLALVDQGVFPWWTDPNVRLSFFRPLAAATHLFDFALFGRAPVLMHAHSILWFALALVAVWFLYRRFFAGVPWLAGLAFLLYALDDAHGAAVGWVANRNAMVAVALGLPALILHDRYRRDGWLPGRWLAPLALAVGLLGGESVVAVVGYLLAHALVFERGRLFARLVPLWPYALVVGAWRAVYLGLGYGAAGSGVYLDPAHDAGPFLAALPSRAAALLAGQLALPWSDFATLYTFLSHRTEVIMMAFGFATVAVCAWAFADVLRKDPVARFFGLGLLFAVVPIASTFPADRLLWFVGVGAMGLLARFFAEPKRWPRKLVAVPLIAIHVVLAPPLLALRSRSMETVERPLARAERSVPSGPGVAGKTVVLVNPPADLFVGYILLSRVARDLPRPERIRWLATGTSGVELVREDARTLRVRPRGGFCENVSERMLRTARAPFYTGWSLALTGITVEVVAVDAAGRPLEARFRFAVPLEDPSLVWMQWGARGYEPFTPPTAGASAALAPIDFLTSVFGAAERRR